jgi:SAM-dependent methyltransferase
VRPEVLTWCKSVLTRDLVEGKRVLEVGSMDVNGSVRTHVESLDPAYYVGIDIAMGVGVDRILNVIGLLDAYGPKKWDLIISTEMLEHCPPWQEAVYQMKESLDKGGWLVLTSVAPGFPNHDWPGDYWRFTSEIFEVALLDLDDVVIQTSEELGIFGIARREGRVGLPSVQALPAPTREEISSEIMVWPELDRMLANAVHAVKAGKLDRQIVDASFLRFKEALREEA